MEKQQTNTYNNNKMLIKNIKILSNASVGPEAPPSKLLKKKNEPKSKNPPEEIIKSLDLFIEVFPSQFNEASKRKPYAIPATRKIIDEVISIYGFEELKRIVEEYKKYSQNKFYAGISSNVYEFCKKIDKIKQSNEKARKEQRAISQPTKMSDNVKPSEIETRKMLGKLTHDLKTPLLDAITVDVIGKYKVKNRDFKFMRKLIYLLGIAEHKFISHYERIGEVEKEYTLFEIYWRAVDRWIEECIQDGQWFRNEDAEAELWDKSIFDL